MTIKEIAELCGVDRRTIERWAHKIADDPGQNAQGLADDLLQNAKGITEKLEEARKSGKDPADFTLDETLAIIGEGGNNKALASLLAENAANRNALAVQSEAMAKIAKLAEKLPELMDRIEAMEAKEKRQEKFNDYAVAAYKRLEASQKELEARVDGAYKEVLDNATANAAAEVQEYLLAAHKPSAHEAQLAELKKFLSLTITATGDRRDKIDFFRLWGLYETARSNPVPKDAFADHVLLLYPQIKFRGGVFIGCHFDY